MREIISGGTTCLFVSHDTAAVQNLCERAVLLEKGEVTFIGDATETVSRYFATFGKNRSSTVVRENCEEVAGGDTNLCRPEEIEAHNILGDNTRRHGTHDLEIIAARATDMDGRDTMQIQMLDRINFYLRIRANAVICDPRAGIQLYDRLGNLVFAASSLHLGTRLPDLNAGDEIVVKIRLKLNVQPGEYTFSLGAVEPLPEQNPNLALIHDRHELLGPIVVIGDCTELMPFYGIAQLPMDVKFNILRKEHG